MDSNNFTKSQKLQDLHHRFRQSNNFAHDLSTNAESGKCRYREVERMKLIRMIFEQRCLAPALVDVVTFLEPFVTKRQVTVVPVIGILWDKRAFNPVPNADEVESIFYAPFEMFLKNENRLKEEREFQGDKYLLHYFDHETNNKEYVIWALTAGILITAASLVFQRPPYFQPRMPKFWNRNYSRF